NDRRRDFPLKLLRGVSASDIVIVDGAEQLSWFRWQSLRIRARNAGGLIITTHTSGRLQRLLETRTSPALLKHLVLQLSNDPFDCDALFARHRGNIRDGLRDLYDLCAQT